MEANGAKITAKDLATAEQPMWCPGCVLPGTMIHTNPAVKAVEVLNVGDRVLGSDGKYHKITEIMKHRHTGKMYAITAKCFGKTVLTHEHPVLIAKREHLKLHNKTFDLVWEYAEKIRKGDYLAYPIPREITDVGEAALAPKLSKDTRSSSLPVSVKITGELLRLCGYYIAEGWVSKRSAKKNNIAASICFAFNENEKEFVDDVTSLVAKIFGVPATIKSRSDKHLVEVYVHSSRLARTFHEWFGNGAPNKRIPHFMMALPIAMQRELLKGLWRGDGWLHAKKARASYKTTSRVLAEQLKLLLLRQGIVPTVQSEKPHGMHKASWALWVLGKRDFPKLQTILGHAHSDVPAGKIPSSVITSGYVMLPVSKIETFDYDGYVHNLEVEDVHSYVSESAILHNCGDFGILTTLKMAIAELSVDPADVLIVTGIGCGSKTNHFIKTYGFEGLHGRALPVATGAKLVNPELTVIVVGGDGDGYGIGGNHFIHTMRRNLDILYVVQNNEVYGLTKGQYSPTSKKGFKSPSTPQGSLEEAVNPISLGITAGATFVARGYAFDGGHLKQLMVDGIRHKGFALIDVLQPCTTYNKVNTMEYFKQRIYKLESNGHDPADAAAALQKSVEWGDRIPVGLFYKTQRPTYEEGLVHVPVPAVKQDIRAITIAPALNRFR